MKILSDEQYNEMKKEIENLKERKKYVDEQLSSKIAEINKLTEEKEKLFANEYDYVILIKDMTTKVYIDGVKQKRIRELNLSCDVGVLPTIVIER